MFIFLGVEDFTKNELCNNTKKTVAKMNHPSSQDNLTAVDEEEIKQKTGFKKCFAKETFNSKFDGQKKKRSKKAYNQHLQEHKHSVLAWAYTCSI